MSQNERILAYLKSGRSITALTALDKFGCFRLASRINQLRDRGISIRSEMVTKGQKHFSKYSLA